MAPDYLLDVCLLKIIASAGCGAIVWWLEQEQPCPPEQLAQWLTQVIYDIAVSSLKPNRISYGKHPMLTME